MTAPEGGTGGDEGASGASGASGGTGSSGSSGSSGASGTGGTGGNELPLSPFADSVYAQPGLTHLVRQYDEYPLRAVSPLQSVASPSPAAVAAEEASQERTVATGVENPSNTRAEATNHHDAYLNFFDST